jgi:hypothetical protein
VSQQRVAPSQNVAVGSVDVDKQLNDSLTTLQTSLQGITDEASAKAALPKLQDVKTKIDKEVNLVGQLSPDQRRTIVGLVSPAVTNLNQLFDKARDPRCWRGPQANNRRHEGKSYDAYGVRGQPRRFPGPVPFAADVCFA